MKDFASLHSHTSYSQLDGASKINELVARAKELGMSALGIEDHGNLNGIIDFYKECRAQDIKPVLGQEFYFTDDRLLKESVKQEDHNGEIDGSDKRYYHLSVYAENNEGYHNLLKLSTDAFTKGFYHKPRSDYATLERFSNGIIVGSGCLGGPVLQPLLHGNYDGALRTAQRLQDIVGKDNFYIELMNHGLPEQAKTNPLLINIAKQIGAEIYATQDTHYTNEHDHSAHDSLLCCQTGSKLADEKRFRFHGNEYYLKSPEQMYEIFKDNPEACDNTLAIAEKCNVEIDFDTLHLPDFPIPEGFVDDVEYLAELVIAGIEKRYPNAGDEVWERVGYELSVIQSMNLASYFLIFHDLVQFTKRERILTGPGRGSSAGSIVAYALEVTKVDPLKHGLIFERFINPDRIALAVQELNIPVNHADTVIGRRDLNLLGEQYGRSKYDFAV